MAESVSDLLELAVLLKEVGLIDREGNAARQPRAAVRDDRRSARLRRHHGRRVHEQAPVAHRRLARQHAGGDARLFRLQQGRRLRHLGLGAVQGRDRAGRDVQEGTASACGCSTAAAARSDAAAARATTRSWRSRPAPSPDRSASPSRARSSRRNTRNRRSCRRNLNIIVAATLDATLIDAKRRRRPTSSVDDDGQALRPRLRGLSQARLRDRRLRGLLLGLDRDQRDRDAEPRQPAGLAQEDARDRGPARHPLGVLWAQCRVMLPGWYGFGSAVEPG